MVTKADHEMTDEEFLASLDDPTRRSAGRLAELRDIVAGGGVLDNAEMGDLIICEFVQEHEISSDSIELLTDIANRYDLDRVNGHVRTGYPGAIEALAAAIANHQPKSLDVVDVDDETNAIYVARLAPTFPAEPVPATTSTEDDWPERSDEPDTVDDALMAEAFARSIAGRFLYVGAWKKWLHWDGKRWANDDSEQVAEAARQYVLDLHHKWLDRNVDSGKLSKLLGYRNRTRIEAVVVLARRIDGITASPDEFDRNPDLLNVSNGIIDLRTKTLGAHDPKLRITKLADVTYDPEAQHVDVDAVVQVVDDNTRPWLQRLLGYAATGHTSEDVVPVFDGIGANGKTTVLDAAGAALGDYAAPVPSKLVMASGRDEHPTILADLRRLRLGWASETAENGTLNTEQVKALSGGDRIKARVMRGDYFDFIPTHTLVIATNHRPRINSTEHAVWRRLRLVPFPYVYRPADHSAAGSRVLDPKLRQRLRTGTAQRSAMLRWIVDGAHQWYQHGLGDCSTVTAATAAWQLEEDVLLRFIEEKLHPDIDGTISGGDLYERYQRWCQIEGRPAKQSKNFVMEFDEHQVIQAHHVVKARPKGSVTYRGVRARELTDSDPVWRPRVGSGGGYSVGSHEEDILKSNGTHPTTPHPANSRKGSNDSGGGQIQLPEAESGPETSLASDVPKPLEDDDDSNPF